MKKENAIARKIIMRAITLLWYGEPGTPRSSLEGGSQFSCLCVAEGAAQVLEIEFGEADDMEIVKMLQRKIKDYMEGSCIMEEFFKVKNGRNGTSLEVQAMRRDALQTILRQLTK